MEWIRVQDRLPEKEIDCLVYQDNFYGFAIGSIWDDGQWYDEDECFLNITHWLPLPQTPKE